MSQQAVEFHFTERPEVDWEAVRARVAVIIGSEVESPEGEKPGARLFVYPEFPIEYADATAPAQTWVLAADQAIDLRRYADDVQQSWMCRDAESLLKDSRHTLLVTEMMSRGLDPQDRVLLLHGVMSALLEHTRPAALVFKHSQQVIFPPDYSEATDRPPINRPGSLNVRFYNVAGTDGDMLMDTRGLEDIGLFDLQCHFRDLEPNDVSTKLLNTAIYLFDNGGDIESGHTIEGIEPGSAWKCQFEESLTKPKRDVLDLNPGGPHAAGRRE